MLSFRTEFRAPQFDKPAFYRNANELADKSAESYANYLKLAIVQSKAIASGQTLHSVKAEKFDNSGVNLLRRAVTAKKSWFWIQIGRAAGKKMPVRVTGTNASGKPIFEPLPEMLSWFRTMNIPRAAWFPILLAIKRRGIKPRDIQGMALRTAKPRVKELAKQYAAKIAQDLFSKGPGPLPGPTI